MEKKPKLLILTVENWGGIARLPKALKNAGFEVAVVCPSISFIAKTLYVDEVFILDIKEYSIDMLKSIVKFIRKVNPSIIIPGDDWIVGFLQYWLILTLEDKCSTIDQDTLKCLQFSLGNPDYYKYTVSKKNLQELALNTGICMPFQKLIIDLVDAVNFANEQGYPVVLKKEFCSGGHGVAICYNQEEVKNVVYKFKSDKENTIIQKYIQGKTVMHSFVAISGKIAASLTAIKEQVNPEPTGPSSIVRFIAHLDIQSIAKTLIKYLGYTGFGSFDYIIEEQSKSVYLLESNPRPTPICHLGKNVGVDLCAALFAEIQGQIYVPSEIKVDYPIALFPQEWRRDFGSIYLQNIYHDVPWDDPILLKAYLDSSLNLIPN